MLPTQTFAPKLLSCLKGMIPRSLSSLMFERKGLIRGTYKENIAKIEALPDFASIGNMVINEQDAWKMRFKKLSRAIDNSASVAEAFFCSKIDILKEDNVRSAEPILICVQRNERVRLKSFVTYYRTLGVKRFFILDNGSTDGSLEWLLDQDDVTVAEVRDPYSTDRREGWINRIINYCGEDRWYLVVDSDEFLDYEGRDEGRTVSDLVYLFEERNVFRARAMMVDMYGRQAYYQSGNPESFLTDCNLFDDDTYYRASSLGFELVCGGPRWRVFGEPPTLTKYPLFKPGKDFVHCNSHMLFPVSENLGVECNLLLRHYKFLPGDLEEYARRAASGLFYNGSEQYKTYIKVAESQASLKFDDPNSKVYLGPGSFKGIREYKAIKW